MFTLLVKVVKLKIKNFQIFVTEQVQFKISEIFLVIMS